MNTPERSKQKTRPFINKNSATKTQRSSTHNMSDSFIKHPTPSQTPQSSSKAKPKPDISFPPLGNTPSRHNSSRK